MQYDEMVRRFEGAIANYLNADGNTLARCRFGSPPFTLFPEGHAFSTLCPDFEPQANGMVDRIVVVLNDGTLEGPYKYEGHPLMVDPPKPFVPCQLKIHHEMAPIPRNVTAKIQDAVRRPIASILEKVEVKGTAEVLKNAERQ